MNRLLHLAPELSPLLPDAEDAHFTPTCLWVHGASGPPVSGPFAFCTWAEPSAVGLPEFLQEGQAGVTTSSVSAWPARPETE